MEPLQQTLVRAFAGQCGLDSAHCSIISVRDVARMDSACSMAYAEINGGVLFFASMLHRFDLTYDYAKLEDFALLDSCPYCSAPLWDPNRHPTRPERIFTWQCHAGRCGRDGCRRHTHAHTHAHAHAHEVFKLVMKRLFLTSSSPGGSVFSSASVLIEPMHLRQDMSRPGDVYDVRSGMHMKNGVINILITSALK
jgi:hypothetical protein